MNFKWFIATRYFKSGRKQSGFLSFIKYMAIGGVAIGAAGLLIALSIVHGFKSAIEDKILGFGTHVTVFTHTNQPIFRADTLTTFLINMPEIIDVQAVIQGQGMVQAGDFVDGTVIKGVDPAGDLSNLRNFIAQGSYDLGEQESGRPGIVMGARLARTLGAQPGRTITLYTVRGEPGPHNFPEIMQFTLSGVYQTGIDIFDDTLVFIDRQHASRLFQLNPPRADQIDIKVADISQIGPLNRQLFDKLPFPYFNETIYQRYSNIFAWINLQEQTIPFVIAVMIIVAAFNLIGTILMMVLERTRDIGILKTMGATDGNIRSVFLYEGIFVGLVGLIIGIVISLLFWWIQGTYELIPLSEENYFLTTAPVEPRLSDFVIVSLVTLSLCAIASWFPARVAARMNPLNVIQFGR